MMKNYKLKKIVLFVVVMFLMMPCFFAPKMTAVYADEQQLTQSVIITPYENNYVEFVYDGIDYSLDYNINSDQEVLMYRILGQEEVLVENKFREIGEYKIKLCAKETATYDAPEDVFLTVRVLPRVLDSTSSKHFPKISIISDKGFSLENTFSPTLNRRESRNAKNAIKSKLKYTEHIVECFKVAPNQEVNLYSEVDLLIEITKDFSEEKNYRIFELNDGNVIEHKVVVNRRNIVLNNVSTDSIFVVTANKPHPYLWIWLTTGALSLVGLGVSIYIFAPRKLKFYLGGEKIYVAKLSRRQEFALQDGLENYEWYVDKEYSIKASTFAVKETGKKYYAKLK